MFKNRRSALGPKYHRVEAIAEYLDYSPRSVRRLIDSGKSKAVKIAGAVRASNDELQRLLLASRIVSTPEE